MSSKDQRVLTVTVIYLSEVKIIPWELGEETLTHHMIIPVLSQTGKDAYNVFFFPSGGTPVNWFSAV